MFNKNKLILIILLIILLQFLSSCASIVRGGWSEINITSEPKNLDIIVKDSKTNTRIFSSTTPTIIQLRKGIKYMKSASYEIIVSYKDYPAATIRLAADETYIGGYIVGNIFSFGWLWGMLIVDPITGAMYKWSAPTVSSGKAQIESNIKGRLNNTLHIVYKEVTQEMIDKDKLEKIQ